MENVYEAKSLRSRRLKEVKSLIKYFRKNNGLYSCFITNPKFKLTNNLAE